MPNWCTNVVEFTAVPDQLKSIELLFKDIQLKQMSEDHGYVPDCILDPENYFFNVRWDDNILYYDTKWAPNINDVKLIADKFLSDFIYEYSELGMHVYGKATYTHGILTDAYLSEDDFQSYVIDEGNNCYLFEGESWASEEEILEIILERKTIKRLF